MKPKIMIVDDDARYLELLEFMLTSAGYETIAVQNPLLVQRRAIKERPDVIVLDVAMPELDGLALGMNLRSESATENIPVVYVTAMSSSRDIHEGMRLGASRYLTKPFSPTELVGVIKEILASGRKEGVGS